MLVSPSARDRLTELRVVRSMHQRKALMAEWSDAFVALRSQALGVPVRDLLLIVLAFNVVDAVVAWPVGALSDRIGRKPVLAK